jgi:hypothetical protein
MHSCRPAKRLPAAIVPAPCSADAPDLRRECEGRGQTAARAPRWRRGPVLQESEPEIRKRLNALRHLASTGERASVQPPRSRHPHEPVGTDSSTVPERRKPRSGGCCAGDAPGVNAAHPGALHGGRAARDPHRCTPIRYTAAVPVATTSRNEKLAIRLVATEQSVCKALRGSAPIAAAVGGPCCWWSGTVPRHNDRQGWRTPPHTASDVAHRGGAWHGGAVLA